MHTTPRNPTLLLAAVAAITTTAATSPPPHHPSHAPKTAVVLPDNTATRDAVATQAEQTALEAAADRARAQAAQHAARRAARHHRPANNLDGWIHRARTIMRRHHIPGSHQNIKRNIIRESDGNPNATNDWDTNAQHGTLSKGLLQMIQPTFDHYHVTGTANEVTDPVANIAAACNYAADRYGSINQVNSAY